MRSGWRGLSAAIVASGLAGAAAAETPVVGVGLAPAAEGVRIAAAHPGYPAAAAGLAVGDVILSVQNIPLSEARQFGAALQADQRPAKLLRIRRAGRERFVGVRPMRLPNPERDAEAFPYPEDFAEPIGLAVAEGGLRYRFVDSRALFGLDDAVWRATFGESGALAKTRIAFYAAIDCKAARLPFLSLSEPSRGVPLGVTAGPSYRFDPAAAGREAAACARYMAENDASGVGVFGVGGRFFSAGPGAAEWFLVDFVLFEQRHMSDLDQVLGAVAVVQDVLAGVAQVESLIGAF